MSAETYEDHPCYGFRNGLGCHRSLGITFKQAKAGHDSVVPHRHVRSGSTPRAVGQRLRRNRDSIGGHPGDSDSSHHYWQGFSGRNRLNSHNSHRSAANASGSIQTTLSKLHRPRHPRAPSESHLGAAPTRTYRLSVLIRRTTKITSGWSVIRPPHDVSGGYNLPGQSARLCPNRFALC